jgi:hypothetical protein
LKSFKQNKRLRFQIKIKSSGWGGTLANNCKTAAVKTEKKLAKFLKMIFANCSPSFILWFNRSESVKTKRSWIPFITKKLYSKKFFLSIYKALFKLGAFFALQLLSHDA